MNHSEFLSVTRDITESVRRLIQRERDWQDGQFEGLNPLSAESLRAAATALSDAEIDFNYE